MRASLPKALLTATALCGCADPAEVDPTEPRPAVLPMETNPPHLLPAPEFQNWTTAPVPVEPAPALWWRTAGGGDNDDAYAIATVGEDVVVAGSFIGAADFGAGAVAAIGWKEAFVARYGPSGELRWIRHFGAPGGLAWAVSVAVGPDGTIAASGTFRTAVDLGEGDVDAVGDDDAFLTVLDGASGDTRWSTTIGDTQWDQGGPVAFAPDGDVVLTGSVGSQLLVARYAPNGDERWSRLTGYVSGALAFWAPVADVAVGEDGRTYVIGSFYGTAELGGGPLRSTGGDDIFLGAFDSQDGATLWSRHYGGPATPIVGGDEGASLEVDGDRLLVSGAVFGNVDLGGGPLEGEPAYWNPFAAALSTIDGGHIWSRSFPGETYGGPLVLLTDGTFAMVSGRYNVVSPSLRRMSRADGVLLDTSIIPLGGAIAATASDHIAVTDTCWGPLEMDGEPVPSLGGSDVFLAVVEPWE